MLFDSHCHLSLEEFAEDIDDVLKRAAEKKIRIISSGDSLETSKENLELVREKKKHFPFIYATAGFHPYHADSFEKGIIETYREMLKDKDIVALGEIGLDYYREYSSKENQKEAFMRFLDLAVEENIPFVIHNRESEEDVINILDKTGIKKFRGVIHCFSSGNADVAREFIKRGLHISFAGQVTFPKAQSLREVVKSVPLNAMLIETDAPYLAPQAKRGKRNEPSLLSYTAEKIAELKCMSLSDIERITLLNTLKLYGIEDKENLKPRVV